VNWRLKDSNITDLVSEVEKLTEALTVAIESSSASEQHAKQVEFSFQRDLEAKNAEIAKLNGLIKQETETSVLEAQKLNQAVQELDREKQATAEQLTEVRLQLMVLNMSLNSQQTAETAILKQTERIKQLQATVP